MERAAGKEGVVTERRKCTVSWLVEWKDEDGQRVQQVGAFIPTDNPLRDWQRLVDAINPASREVSDDSLAEFRARLAADKQRKVS